MAYTWRKSSFSAPGTVPACHVSPPSLVRTNVPPVPLTQTTLSLTMLNPSRLASVFGFCGCHWAKAAAVMTAPAPTGARNVRIRTFFIWSAPSISEIQAQPHALVRRKIIADDLAALHNETHTGEVRPKLPGSRAGTLRNNSALIKLKMAVLAPMRKVKVTTAIPVNPGDLRNVRMPKRKSCQHVSTNDSQAPERTTPFRKFETASLQADCAKVSGAAQPILYLFFGGHLLVGA